MTKRECTLILKRMYKEHPKKLEKLLVSPEKEHHELINAIYRLYPELDTNVSEAVYLAVHNLKYIPKCSEDGCINNAKFYGLFKGYDKTCKLDSCCYEACFDSENIGDQAQEDQDECTNSALDSIRKFMSRVKVLKTIWS
jgi:hypothetical protein